MSRRVSFSPEPQTASDNGGANIKGGGKKNGVILKIWIFKVPKGSRCSPSSFFRQIGAKMVRALPLVAAPARRKCSRKVSSASLARSRSYAETLDSQRAEAIEDCIEFLNSSSSLQRSNSVNSSC